MLKRVKKRRNGKKSSPTALALEDRTKLTLSAVNAATAAQRTLNRIDRTLAN